MAQAETEPLVRLADGSIIAWNDLSEKVKAELSAEN
jgi:hypothetical protein